MIEKDETPNEKGLNIIERISDSMGTLNIPMDMYENFGIFAKNLKKTLNPDIKDQNTSTIFTENDVWKIKVTLTNGTNVPIPIPPLQIEKIVLENSLAGGIAYKGIIVLKSKRLGNILSFNGDEASVDRENEFIFRGDGKDEIQFEINPSYEKNLLPEEIWFIKNLFIVDQIVDVPVSAGHNKKIVFYFKPYHTLAYHNCNFSTSNNIVISDLLNIHQLSNDDRKIYTGDAIRFILEEAGLRNYIDTSEGMWSRGTTKIFFNSGPKETAMSAIDYMIKYHVDEDGYPAMFFFNRGKNKFQLLSIKHFFDKAGNTNDEPGDYQLEHFWIRPLNTGIQEKTIMLQKAPLDPVPKSLSKDIKDIGNKNIITENNYLLNDMSGSINTTEITPVMVHSYRHSKKKFSANIKNNTITKIKDEFTKSFSNQLFPGETGEPLFPLNKEKVNNYVFQNRYQVLDNVDENSLVNLGKNNIIKKNIFFNLMITFMVPGSTHRHIGRFIAIEKFGDVENKYDDRLLGQWFVVSTKFIFIRGKLFNEINAVKINTQQSLNFNEDV
jgi:hypothetical protein